MVKLYALLSSIICLFIFSLSSINADYCDVEECSPVSCWMPYPLYGEASFDYDSFRCLPDGSFVDNSGAYLSLNLAAPLPYMDDYGFGMQVGGSYGIYDWSGRASNPFGNAKEIQQQGFFTVGLFRVTPYCSGVNFGVVYDLMINRSFGTFAVDNNFSQVRFKLGYLFENNNEFGVWGSAYTNTVNTNSDYVPLKFRAISQVNLFWQHYFCTGAQTMVWIGMPYNDGLMLRTNGRRGRAGNFILGAHFNAPLSECWSVNGHAGYLRPPSAPGISESKDYGTNVAIGVTYSFGCAKASAVRPYQEIADNSNFFADTNFNF